MILKTTLMYAACISVFFFQHNDNDGAMANYSDAMRRRYVCGIIVVEARGSGGMLPQENF